MHYRQNKFAAVQFLTACALVALTVIGNGQTVSAQTAATTSSAYLIRTGDVIDISVLGHPEFVEELTVLPDGTINYPIAGTVHVSGLTLNETTSILSSKLSSVLNTPQVTVSVKQSQPETVSVVGAVKNPGAYPFVPGWHILQALAASGGLLQDPQLTQAMVMKPSGETTPSFEVAPLMNGQDQTHNVELEPGDVVLIQQRDPALSQVQVLGEVKQPGAVTVSGSGASALAVLSDAGGPTPVAALSTVQIMHQGKVQVVNLRSSLKDLGAGGSESLVYPGDTVLVPARNQFAVIGAVTAPGTFPVPDDKQLKVSAALGLAGGPTSDADKRKSGILRTDANGNATFIHVDLDKILKGDSTEDIVLQPDDVLYVANRGSSGLGTRDILPFVSPFLFLLKN